MSGRHMLDGVLILHEVLCEETAEYHFETGFWEGM